MSLKPIVTLPPLVKERCKNCSYVSIPYCDVIQVSLMDRNGEVVAKASGTDPEDAMANLETVLMEQEGRN